MLTLVWPRKFYEIELLKEVLDVIYTQDILVYVTSNYE